MNIGRELDAPGVIEDIDLAHGKLVTFLQVNYKGKSGEATAGKPIGDKPKAFVTYEPSGPITNVETQWNRNGRALAGIRFYCGKRGSVPFGNSDTSKVQLETAEFEGFHLSHVGGERNGTVIFALELGFRHDSLQ